MSEEYVDDDVDDIEDEESLDFEEDEGDEEDQLDLIEDDTSMLDASQFNNKNKYDDISTIEASIASKTKRSKNRMTKYEKTKVLGHRQQELANGMPSFIDTTGMYDINLIAEKELEEDKIPYILRRVLPDGTSEYFRLQDFKK